MTDLTEWPERIWRWRLDGAIGHSTTEPPRRSCPYIRADLAPTGNAPVVEPVTDERRDIPVGGWSTMESNPKWVANWWMAHDHPHAVICDASTEEAAEHIASLLNRADLAPTGNAALVEAGVDGRALDWITPATVTTPTEDLTALQAAERFISGFEGDQTQEGVADLLWLIRTVIANGPKPSQASIDVLAERQRQMAVKSWTPEHDDGHDMGELGLAAALYALPYEAEVAGEKLLQQSDFIGLAMALEIACDWNLKPEPDRRKRLVKAGALILAEIEREDRAAIAKRAEGGE